jgi:16S rRNA (adenine1518-N6/adenine1519-N6)-dimethyltransferase
LGFKLSLILNKEKIFERLQELGAEPKRSLGQNFLISERAVTQIVGAAQRNLSAYAAAHGTPQNMIEIGPGLGSLTESLVTLGVPFQVIELDKTFAEYWTKRGVKVTEADALKLDWRDLNLPAGTLLVSNLPYQISSSLVIERSMAPDGVTQMILMFQKEVGQRLLAKQSTDAYGLLSVIAQTFWKMANLIEVSPREFYPAPNVVSRVLTFEWANRVLPEAGTAVDFLKLAKAAFAHRRKLMMKNLVSGWGGLDQEAWQKVFEATGLLPTARAEELDPPTYLRLYEHALKARG